MESKVAVFQFPETQFRVLILKIASGNKYDIYIKQGSESMEKEHENIHSNKSSVQVPEVVSSVSQTEENKTGKVGGMQLRYECLIFCWVNYLYIG